MKPTIASLRTKMILLLLAAVILPLLAVGVGLDAYLRHLHWDQAHDRSRQAITVLEETLAADEQWLREATDALRTAESTVAAFNLVERYQEIRDYRPIVFDEAKKSLVRELLEVIERGQADRGYLHQADGRLLGYVRREAGEPVVGIVSFADGRPRFLERRVDGEWSVVEPPADRYRYRPMAQSLGVVYLRRPDRAEQVMGRPVLREPGDADSARLGSVTLVHDLDPGFLGRLPLPDGVSLGLLSREGWPVADTGGLAALDGDRLTETVTAHLEAPGTRRWFAFPGLLLSLHALPNAEESADMLVGIGIDRSQLERQVAAARWVVLAALASSALIFIPIGLLVIRRRLQRPLDRLIAGVTALRQGDYACRVEPGRDREIRQLAESMNAMAGVIQRREDELREIIENIPEMIFVKDAEDLRFVRFNRAGEQLLGLSRETLLGHGDHDFFPPEQAEAFVAGDREVLAGGAMVEIDEEPIDTPRGRRLLRTRKVPITDPDGRPRFLLGISEDITERRRDEARLREAQAVARMGDWQLDLETREAVWPEQTRRILDVAADEPAGPETLRRHCHPDDWPRVERALAQVLAGEGDYDVEYRLLTGDGDERIVHSRAQLEEAADGRPRRLVGVVQDVTERVQAEQQQRLANAVLENTSEAVIVTDAEGRILRTNPAFTTITGYRAEEVRGENPRLLKSDLHEATFYAGIWQALAEQGQWQGEIWNRRKDGTVFPAWQTIGCVYDETGRVRQYVSLMSDITPLKEVEERLDYMAYHDPLTNLPNRHLLGDRLEHAIARAHREGCRVGVLFLDLDRFKNINDSLGHPLGDALLQAVARRLGGVLREADTLARLGGDEFVVVMESVGSEEEMAALAEKLLAAFAEPFRVQGHELSVDASIGISVYPLDGEDASILVRNADTAMYRAKEAHRNHYVFYTAELTENANRRVALEMELRSARERGELMLYYQPQVDLAAGRVVALEALIRWNNPRLGWVSPADLIPLAEETRLILPIGEWVLERACRDFRALLDVGHDLQRMAVNVSPEQVQHAGLVAAVERAIGRAGLEAGHLELEVTEAAFMRDPETAIDTLNRLHEMGVALAVDDFGTGFSSLAYLKQFPVSRLKIDQSFVRDMLGDADDRAIVRSVIALGRSLELAVIAEGVETERHAGALRDEGCGEAQGYLYTRPLPHAELAAWLEAFARRGTRGA